MRIPHAVYSKLQTQHFHKIATEQKNIIKTFPNTVIKSRISGKVLEQFSFLDYIEKYIATRVKQLLSDIFLVFFLERLVLFSRRY